jgi:hypothetical protein
VPRLIGCRSASGRQPSVRRLGPTWRARTGMVRFERNALREEGIIVQRARAHPSSSSFRQRKAFQIKEASVVPRPWPSRMKERAEFLRTDVRQEGEGDRT